MAVKQKTQTVLHIIGAGLAGSEAAWQAAGHGVPVILHEMRPTVKTDVHETDGCAELVCSNSFRSDDSENNAVGVLHEEMRILGSLIMEAGDAARVPAGSALAVDRDDFSGFVTKKLEGHPLITLERNEVKGLPPKEWQHTIIATGPLTSPSLSEAILKLTGEDELAFFDAIAPIIHKESINFDIAWFQSRYDKGAKDGGESADYINCPMDEAQYNAFIEGLINSEKMDFKEWEKSTPYFEGCMPIEVMAERGPETLRFGPMKPVGLTNPNSDKQAHAVVQLRQDNKLGSLYNMVGFQTKMKHGAQVELFRAIPGLEKAEFARLGGLHRNTFLNSPKLLDGTLRLKADKRLRFAGQITGVEGYVESAAMGLLTGRFAAADILGEDMTLPAPETAHGALLVHITGGHLSGKNTFQPMNVNFGLFPPLAERMKKRDRKPAYARRALQGIKDFV